MLVSLHRDLIKLLGNLQTGVLKTFTVKTNALSFGLLVVKRKVKSPNPARIDP